jgi:hypothetical protein
MDEATDHKARSLLLLAENQYLRSELEEFQFRERSLRKELEIMAQVRGGLPAAGPRSRGTEGAGALPAS